MKPTEPSQPHSADPANSPPTTLRSAFPPHPRAYLAIAILVLGGTALFATGAIAQSRQSKTTPAQTVTVLGRPAWQIATAGLISTLAGGLWLRRLVK